MLAKRNQQKPLIPPTYNMCNVPRCHKSEDGNTLLIGSQVQEITKREYFADNTAELVLLCNEVMRRQQIGTKEKTTSKPLSLEYIADRMDIDDPIFGYFVRTTSESRTEDKSPVEPGMLQGFVMVTTFTNWQTTFRWDSMHDSAFAYDEELVSRKMNSGDLKHDKDGSIAAKLQATTRCGDPWNEGIVWPRIAEISLLGGLSCGKVLLELAIEELERMPPTAVRNYDYVALQATKNSVSFYERMGFVRVGAVTKDTLYLKRREADENNDDLDSKNISLAPSGEENVEEDANEYSIVSSPAEIYVTIKGGETPLTVAKKFKVDVWDIIFLNHYIHKDIQLKSWLYKGTQLFIPSSTSEKEAITNTKFVADDELNTGQFPRWYIAKENETPRSISKKFKLICTELIKANSRIQGLVPSIRLKGGTKLQISHFDLSDDMFIPYNHWTFPDDVFENLDPSYMMVRKLNRKTGSAAKKKPVQQKLHLMSEYIHNEKESSFFFINNEEDKNVKIRSKKNHLQPKKLMDAFSFFSRDARTRMRTQLARKTIEETNTIIMSAWNDLAEPNRNQYEEMASKAERDYEQAKTVISSKGKVCPKKKEVKRSKTPLFNQVVTLNFEGIKYHGDEFPYYYVLTYLPDLEWCHLCPMIQNGILDNGRPRWILIHEGQGKEIDTSALLTEVTESKGLHGCPDADEEEWDIFECKAVIVTEELLNLSQRNTTSTLEVLNRENITTPSAREKGHKNKKSSKKQKKTKTVGDAEGLSDISKYDGVSNQLKFGQLIPKLPVTKAEANLKKRKVKKLTPKTNTDSKKSKVNISKQSKFENTPESYAEPNHLMTHVNSSTPMIITNNALNQAAAFHVNINRNEAEIGNRNSLPNSSNNVLNLAFPTPPPFFQSSQHQRPEYTNIMTSGIGIPSRMVPFDNNTTYPAYHHNQPFVQNVQMTNESGMRQGMPQDQMYHYQSMSPIAYSHGQAYFRDMHSRNRSPKLPNEGMQNKNAGDGYR